MYCKKCQNVIKDNEYYCPYCGYNNKKDELPKENNDMTVKRCILNFFTKSFSAKGVATRKEFWLIYLFYLIIAIILGLIGLKIAMFNYINTFLNIILFFPLMALSIRRYHDINKSGVYAILGAYFKVTYFFSFYVSDDNTKLILLVTSFTALIAEIILLSLPTNKNSRWNPENGYLE